MANILTLTIPGATDAEVADAVTVLAKAMPLAASLVNIYGTHLPVDRRTRLKELLPKSIVAVSLDRRAEDDK